MRTKLVFITAVSILFGLAAVVSEDGFAQKRARIQPQRGGVLKYIIPSSGAPSLDAHRETTFATVHPTAPFYSLLLYTDPTSRGGLRLTGDLAVGFKVSDKKRRYAFKIRKGVKFHDGSPLTAKDVVASWEKLVFPEKYGKDVLSARKDFFRMIQSVRALNSSTVEFQLRHATSAFIPVVAMPFNYVYKADILKKNPRWYEKNVMGSGPFAFVEYVPKARIVGKRNPDFYLKGLPYLDGFEATFSRKQYIYLQALRDRRIHSVFRGLPPGAVADLKKELGNKVRVQESDWNCSVALVFNTTKAPFNDKRVRQALSLGIDRWKGGRELSETGIVKTVGGLTFPRHYLSPDKKALRDLPGYGDINKERAKAKKLLKAAKQTKLKFELLNRGTDQPYKVVGVWLVREWKKIGVTATIKTEPTSKWYALRRSKDYAAATDASCQSLVNPTIDIAKYIPSGGNDYSGYKDAVFEKLHDQQLHESNRERQKRIIYDMHKRAMEGVWTVPILWYNRFVVHDVRMKGWRITPSHYLNMRFAQVWLDLK